jgi:hypothetical protein
VHHPVRQLLLGDGEGVAIKASQSTNSGPQAPGLIAKTSAIGTM